MKGRVPYMQGWREKYRKPSGRGWFFHDTRRAWPCLYEQDTGYLCLWVRGTRLRYACHVRYRLFHWFIM